MLMSDGDGVCDEVPCGIGKEKREKGMGWDVVKFVEAKINGDRSRSRALSFSFLPIWDVRS